MIVGKSRKTAVNRVFIPAKRMSQAIIGGFIANKAKAFCVKREIDKTLFAKITAQLFARNAFFGKYKVEQISH